MSDEKEKETGKENETTPETPPETGKKARLEWPHIPGAPGQIATFYGVECKANKDGIYKALVPAEIAERELNRANRRKFIKG